MIQDAYLTNAHALLDELLIALVDRKPGDPLAFSYAYLKSVSRGESHHPDPLTDGEI